MTFKVLHLSTYAGNGGAGRAASSLHHAMLDEGIDSTLLTAHGTRFRAASEMDRTLWRLQSSPHSTWRSPARFGSLSARTINALGFDVVNLHWVTDGFLTVEQIGRIASPVVWTMHDMWPFTGTEHYTADVSDPQTPSSAPLPRWEAGFTSTNRPSDETGFDIDRWTWNRKRRHWTRQPQLVPVSTWLQGLARRSALAAEWPSRVIPNVMPVDRFLPRDRQDARRELGLPPDSPLIAFTASAGIGDRRKGWQHLRDALPTAQRRYPDVGVIVIGPHSPRDDPGTSAPIHWQGEIHDDDAMALAIAAADVVAVPSETDNLPMTACEAQSCGRAVVAFDVGGLPDIVGHQQSGYLAQPFDTADFGEGLIQAIAQAKAGGLWETTARAEALRKWSPGNVIDQYRDLYASMTSTAH